MAARVRILYFLEDRAQEGLVKALVERVAKEESIVPYMLTHDVRSASHGCRVVSEFESFIRDMKEMSPADVDLLIVAIDGNCHGYRDRTKDLKRGIPTGHPLFGKIVFAVPDPHIERWYIMDQRAFKLGVGIDRAPAMPAYKCERNHYKQLLHQTLAEADISSLFGGTEYAESIVSKISSLDALFIHNGGFEAFVRGLRDAFRHLQRK